MSYYNYQNGLIYRHLNQEGGWDSHLGRCRSFIIKALDFHKPEKVTVLGSGWLLDLPLAEMLDKTEKICLVDIIHPPEVVSQVGTYKNVELLEEDVTGGLINEVWQKTKGYSFFRKMKSLETINIPEYNPVFDLGMVISLNILTQFEMLLLDFLRKRSKISEEEINRFRTEVQKKHIDFLIKHKSVLITDFAEIVTKKSGDISTIPTLFTEVPAGRFREEWTWNFDLKGADYYNRRSVMKVLSVTL